MLELTTLIVSIHIKRDWRVEVDEYLDAGDVIVALGRPASSTNRRPAGIAKNW